MKRLFFIVVAVMFFVPLTLNAGSIGGVMTQGQGKFNLGFEFDYLSSRDMEIDKAPSFAVGRTIKEIEIGPGYFLGAVSSVGITKNVDIYAKIGMADYESSLTVNNAGGDIKVKGDADSALAYGIGMKGSFPIEYGLIVGADLMYMRHDNDEDGKRSGSLGNLDLNLKSKSSQWHIAPYVARQMDDYIAYCGFRYSDYKVEVDDDTTNDSWEIKSQDNIGIFVGGDFYSTDNLIVNVELRLIDETAGSATVTYKF